MNFEHGGNSSYLRKYQDPVIFGPFTFPTRSATRYGKSDRGSPQKPGFSMGINILNLGKICDCLLWPFFGSWQVKWPEDSKVGNGNLQPAGLLVSGNSYTKKDAAHWDIHVFFIFYPHVISRSHAFVRWLWMQKPSYTHLYHTFPTSPPQKKTIPHLRFCGDFSTAHSAGMTSKIRDFPRSIL